MPNYEDMYALMSSLCRGTKSQPADQLDMLATTAAVCFRAGLIKAESEDAAFDVLATRFMTVAPSCLGVSKVPQSEVMKVIMVQDALVNEGLMPLLTSSLWIPNTCWIGPCELPAGNGKTILSVNEYLLLSDNFVCVGRFGFDKGGWNLRYSPSSQFMDNTVYPNKAHQAVMDANRTWTRKYGRRK